MVEFALTMPLLVMFLLGIITSGFTFNQKLAISDGVREGSRFGATLPVAAACSSGTGTVACWLAQVADVTQSASEGNLSSSAPGLEVCVAFFDGTTVTSLRRTASGDTTGTTQCFSDGRPTAEKRVQVTAKRQGQIEYMLGTATPTLTSQSVTKFEAS
jgi:Flp pilus assembly protein TadG